MINGKIFIERIRCVEKTLITRIQRAKKIVTIGCHVDIHKQKSARFLSSISAIILCIYNAY